MFYSLCSLLQKKNVFYFIFVVRKENEEVPVYEKQNKKVKKISKGKLNLVFQFASERDLSFFGVLLFFVVVLYT